MRACGLAMPRSLLCHLLLEKQPCPWFGYPELPQLRSSLAAQHRGHAGVPHSPVLATLSERNRALTAPHRPMETMFLEAPRSLFPPVGTFRRPVLRVACPCCVLSVGNRATRKYIVHPETGDLIDDALVLYFPGPHRYAGLTRFWVQCVGALTAFLAPAASLAKTWPNSTCTEVERSFPQRWTPCSLFL